jgi:hypothetical protein
LRVPCQALFDTGRTDQYDADLTGIEDSSYLLKTHHPQAVSLVDQNERWVRNSQISEAKLSSDVTIGWLQLRERFAEPVMLGEKLGFVFFARRRMASSCCSASSRSGRLARSFNVSRADRMLEEMLPGALTTLGV